MKFLLMKNTQLRMDVTPHVLDYVLMRVIVDAKDYAHQLVLLPVVITVLVAVNQLMVLLLPIAGVKVIMILVLVHQIQELLGTLTLLAIAIMVVVDVLEIAQMLAMEHVVAHVVKPVLPRNLLMVVLE